MLDNNLNNANEIIAESMLTTLDNPYNPFTQWEEWFVFDTQMGYNTCPYLARVAKTSDELSELDNDQAITQAMNDIIFLNVTGNYAKVTKENFKEIVKVTSGG